MARLSPVVRFIARRGGFTIRTPPEPSLVTPAEVRNAALLRFRTPAGVDPVPAARGRCHERGRNRGESYRPGPDKSLWTPLSGCKHQSGRFTSHGLSWESLILSS